MQRILYILILLPFLSKAQSISITTTNDTVCSGTSAVFFATAAGITSPHYQWKINALNAGSDTAAFVTSALVNGDIVKCLLANSTGDTVFAISDSITMTVQNPPNAGVISGSDSVCVGDTIFLSDNMPDGVWSESNNYASISSTGMTIGISIAFDFETNIYPGIDTIFYTLSNMCGSDSANKVIVVNAAPDPSIDIPYEICVGQSYYPEYGHFGITSSSNGSVAVGLNSISGVYAGYDVIYNTLLNTCGSNTATYGITVLASLTISPIMASTNHICVNSSIQLSDATNGFQIWSASNNNASVSQFTGAVGSGGLVTGLKPGLVTINLRAWNNCSNGDKFISSIDITVNPLDTIANPGKVCVGDSILLSDKDLGGQWRNYNPAITTINENSGKLNALASGIDTIYYSLSNGCTVKSLVKVLQTPPAISGADITCSGSSITLVDTGNGTWSSSDLAIATMEYDGKASGIHTGYDTIAYTYSNGCAATKQIRVVDCSEGSNIFPNPVTDELIIEANTNQFSNCTITNCIGQVMIRTLLNQPLTEINTERWPRGVYFVSLWNGNSKETHKVVKE